MPRKKATEGEATSKAASTKKTTKTRAATTADARPVRVKIPVRAFTFSTPAPAEGSQPAKKVVKKNAAAKKSTSVTRKTTPAYLKMITKAISSIGHRSGSNLVAISHYIEKNYPVKENYKRYLKAAIKRAVDGGEIVKNGAMYRVKTSAKKKRTTKRVKKTTEGESPKKPRTKKATTEKSAEKASPKKRAAKADDGEKKAKKPRKNAKSAEQEARAEDTTTSAEAVGPKKPDGLKSDYIWQYMDKTWKNYFTEASNTVEDTYQKYLANRGDTDVRSVRSGDWEYQVDFAAMKQTNIQHDNHTTRPIRRIKCSL